MKKVLSVLLAAAMVMGMSVASFAAADVIFGSGSDDVTRDEINVGDIEFNYVRVFNEDDELVGQGDDTVDIELHAGDVLYFALNNADATNIGGQADEDWKIKINNAKYVESAEFFYDEDGEIGNADCLWVEVTLKDDFDSYEEETATFYFYIYDADAETGYDKKSDYVKVSYDFEDYDHESLTSTDLNWVITVDGLTPVKYTSSGSKLATIDFDGIALGEFKMYKSEKYVLDVESNYNKALSKEWDESIDVVDFTLKGVDSIDLLFLADEDEQVVAVVDGELVPVEAEWVEDYEFESGEVTDGLMVYDAEYTSYAIVSADLEIEAEEEVKAEVEADKANPETGAADFVGAAVAMAVVSVAAAGALALKK